MTILLYENLAASTLQSGISSSALTVVLATGTGALFPQPVPGTSAFYMTFLDAATKQVNEVVLCTARTGDALTIVRAQQATVALSWSAGDIATQLWTMGDADLMIQPDQLQGNLYGSAIANGTNSLTATVPSGLTALPDMFSFTLEAAHANTGNVTLTLTLGTTVLSAHGILKFGGSQLNPSDIPAAGYPIELVWSATYGAYVMTNPASNTSGSIAGGATNDILIQTAPGTTGFVPAPTIAGQVLAFVSGAVSWALAAVTSWNGRSGAVSPQSGDYTPSQVSAVAAAAFNSPNTFLSQPGFVVLPGGASAGGDGMIIQVGTQSVSPNTDTYPSFPKIFPNTCLGVVCSCNNQGSAINVDSFTQSSFHVRVNASQISWIAIGF